MAADTNKVVALTAAVAGLLGVVVGALTPYLTGLANESNAQREDVVAVRTQLAESIGAALGTLYVALEVDAEKGPAGAAAFQKDYENWLVESETVTAELTSHYDSTSPVVTAWTGLADRTAGYAFQTMRYPPIGRRAEWLCLLASSLEHVKPVLCDTGPVGKWENGLPTYWTLQDGVLENPQVDLTNIGEAPNPTYFTAVQALTTHIRQIALNVLDLIDKNQPRRA